jgi:hypothetical protein
MENGRLQKPPFMATQPQRHASTKDPSTWCDYHTALASVQAGNADGVSYILTEHDPFAAIDLDHCRNVGTHSIDPWAQNFLDTGRNSYSEVTPSGTGCRIWGLADGNPLHKKFSLQIDGKDVAVELFRRANKALTVTGYKLDTGRAFTNIDRVIDRGIIWGERRKAAPAAEASAPIEGNGFDGGGCAYSIGQIEQMVREGVTAHGNRSDTFHTIVGHYLGCGWNVEQILEHLQQFPEGRSPEAPASIRRAPCRCSRRMAAGPTVGTQERRRRRSPEKKSNRCRKHRSRYSKNQHRKGRRRRSRIPTQTAKWMVMPTVTNRPKRHRRIPSCRRSTLTAIRIHGR